MLRFSSFFSVFELFSVCKQSSPPVFSFSHLSKRSEKYLQSCVCLTWITFFGRYIYGMMACKNRMHQLVPTLIFLRKIVGPEITVDLSNQRLLQFYKQDSLTRGHQYSSFLETVLAKYHHWFIWASKFLMSYLKTNLFLA